MVRREYSISFDVHLYYVVRVSKKRIENLILIIPKTRCKRISHRIQSHKRWIINKTKERKKKKTIELILKRDLFPSSPKQNSFPNSLKFQIERHFNHHFNRWQFVTICRTFTNRIGGKRIEFRSPVYADYPGGIVDPSPELSPKIAWNGNEDLREYTWSNLPNVFDCASSEERYLTGIASMKLSPHPRCLLSLSPTNPSPPGSGRLLAKHGQLSILLPSYTYIYQIYQKFDTVNRFNGKMT